MKKWLDAAYPPSDAELVYFAVNGWTGIAGYFKFGNDGVLNGWADADFQRVQAAGLQTLAYCSGWADPAQCAARAANLKIQICLDDEGGMRPDGIWVPGWLSASGAGLYGNGPVHVHSAPFHILAAYPGYDPGAVWSTVYAPQPPTPCGWQWQGSHNVDGANVDSSWFDDAIGGVFGSSGTSVGGLDLNVYLLAHLIYLTALGRPYRTVDPTKDTTFGATGIEAQWLIDLLNTTPNDVGATLGHALNSPEGTAWMAQFQELRSLEGKQLVTEDELVNKINIAISTVPTLDQINSVIATEIAKIPPPTVPSLWDVFKATFAAPSKNQ